MSKLETSPYRQPEDPRTRIRRTDRALEDDTRITELLHRQQVGFIATSLDNQPFLNPNLYWFDEAQGRIYFHTASVGRTRANIEANPKVCFGVADMGDLIPAETAMEFSTEYASVLVFGQARVVEDRNEAEHGLYGLLGKYFPEHRPGEHYQAITPQELTLTSVFAIEIETWSGKQKKLSE